MAGLFIIDCENDDVRGTCQCTLKSDQSTLFPGIRILSQASQETDHSIDYYSCDKGQFPTIL